MRLLGALVILFLALAVAASSSAWIAYRELQVSNARLESAIDAYATMSQEVRRSAEGRYPAFCEPRFAFLANHREAASFSIHSASSFTLNPYRACSLREALLKSKRLPIFSNPVFNINPSGSTLVD
jgi:hypothetical protein